MIDLINNRIIKSSCFCGQYVTLFLKIWSCLVLLGKYCSSIRRQCPKFIKETLGSSSFCILNVFNGKIWNIIPYTSLKKHEICRLTISILFVISYQCIRVTEKINTVCQIKWILNKFRISFEVFSNACVNDRERPRNIHKGLTVLLDCVLRIMKSKLLA